MKEPERIPLTDNPRSKNVKKFPLTTTNPNPDVDNYKKLWVTPTANNENNSENNSQSISELESDSTH